MGNKTSFINNTDLVFKDISTEKVRHYRFPNGRNLVIQNPLFINISKTGGHRVFDQEGLSYYIKPSESWWIKWEAKVGEANFVK